MEQNSKVVLVVLCGLPASGKSHLCQELQKTLLKKNDKTENPIVVLISYDVLIPQITPDQWRSQRREVLEAISLLIRTYRSGEDRNVSWNQEGTRGTTTMADGTRGTTTMTDVILRENPQLIRGNPQFSPSSTSSPSVVFILDDNMYYRSMRYEVYQLAVAFGTGFCQIFLEIEPSIAKQRNEKRSSPVPERVIDRMDKLMEGPDVQKNKFEQFTCFLDCPWEENDLEKVANLIEKALKNPVQTVGSVGSLNSDGSVGSAEAARLAEEKARAREINQNNLHHVADLILRHFVHEKQKSFVNSDVAEKMRTINQCRKTVFQNFKKLDLECFEPEIHRDLIERFLAAEFEKLYSEESFEK